MKPDDSRVAADLVVGRELDFAIAEHVIGIRACKCERFTLNETKFPSECLDCGNQLVPHYSTSIAAAMEVLTVLRQRFPGSIAIWVTHQDKFIVQIWDTDENEVANELADDLPEAICRAALAATTTP